jgi:hypothetical protein
MKKICSFFKKSSNVITYSKKSILFGVSITLFLSSLLAIYVFIKPEMYSAYLFAGYVVSAFIGLLFCFKFKINSGKITFILFTFLSPLIFLVISELLNGLMNRGFTVIGFFAGYFFVFILDICNLCYYRKLKNLTYYYSYFFVFSINSKLLSLQIQGSSVITI